MKMSDEAGMWVEKYIGSDEHLYVYICLCQEVAVGAEYDVS